MARTPCDVFATVLAAVGCGVLATGAVGATFQTVPLGSGSITRLSSDGTTAVGYATQGGTHGLYWRTGQPSVVSLPAITGLSVSVARGVSANGRYVGGSANVPSGTPLAAAFRFDTLTNTMVASTPDRVTFAYGISGDGQQVLGAHEDAGNIDCASWQPGQGWLYHGLVPDTIFNFTVDSNYDASLVAGYAYDPIGNKRAFCWDMAGGLRLMPTFVPFEAGEVADVNNDGTVLLGGLQGLPVRWNGPNAAPQYIPAAMGAARAMNADASIIAGGPSSSTNNDAFIWDAVHGTRSFYDFAASEGVNVTGLNFVNVTGISEDGLVFAGNLTQGGVKRGFILSLAIPAPGAIAVAPVVLVCALRRRR